MSYDLLPIKAPRLAGRSLHAFVLLLENGLTRSLLAPKLLRDAGIARFRETVVDEVPSVKPALPGQGALPAEPAVEGGGRGGAAR